MSRNSTKITLIFIVALILVCGGSFVGVKMLNESSTKAATTMATTLATTTAATTTPTTAATTQVLADIETMPVATTSGDDEDDAEPAAMTAEDDADSDDFTTYATASKASADENAEDETTEAVAGEGTEAAEETTTETTTKKAAIVTTSSASADTSFDANNFEVEDEEDAQEVIDEASKFSDGFLGYLYDEDGNFFYTSTDPWQRYMGFNQVYDMGAPFLVFYYDTMRLKFTADNHDWMIQFWKGQYGWVFIGAEIGVYYKPTDRTIEHYDCVPDADTLKMSMTFYRDGEEKATRDYTNYWWCTAFVPGTLDKFSDRSELEVRARITAKDYAMLLGICSALKENGYTLGEGYTVNGLDVFIIY